MDCGTERRGKRPGWKRALLGWGVTWAGCLGLFWLAFGVIFLLGLLAGDSGGRVLVLGSTALVLFAQGVRYILLPVAGLVAGLFLLKEAGLPLWRWLFLLAYPLACPLWTGLTMGLLLMLSGDFPAALETAGATPWEMAVVPALGMVLGWVLRRWKRWREGKTPR